jgi:hypothetical protein
MALESSEEPHSRAGDDDGAPQTFEVSSVMYYDGGGHRLGPSLCTLTRTHFIIEDARGGISQILVRDINGVSTPGRTVSPKQIRITAPGVAYDIYCHSKDQKYQLEESFRRAIRGGYGGGSQAGAGSSPRNIVNENGTNRANSTGSQSRGRGLKFAFLEIGLILLFAFWAIVRPDGPGHKAGADSSASSSSSGSDAAPHSSVAVSGSSAWTDSGIDATGGSLLSIQASGTIKIAGSDPGKYPDGSTPGRAQQPCVAQGDATAPGLTCYILIGKIGQSGQPFEIGYSTSLRASQGGRLYLGVNDGEFGDNSGAWQVTVSGSP